MHQRDEILDITARAGNSKHRSERFKNANIKNLVSPSC